MGNAALLRAIQIERESKPKRRPKYRAVRAGEKNPGFFKVVGPNVIKGLYSSRKSAADVARTLGCAYDAGFLAGAKFI